HKTRRKKKEKSAKRQLAAQRRGFQRDESLWQVKGSALAGTGAAPRQAGVSLPSETIQDQ
ncbi:MAG: hypothetical protein IIY93_10990, partial [Clostridia bacterium]|nr:hypothetical protein [Clostridia bacterium]